MNNQPIQPFHDFLQHFQNVNFPGLPLLPPLLPLEGQLPDVLPPLLPIQLDGNRTILSPNVPRRYLVRQIGTAWHRSMEEIFDDVAVGTRILIRRDITIHPLTHARIIVDYITTRIAQETFLGHWTHQDVVYLENEVTPYPFDMDAYHQRNEILENNWNNNNHQHMAVNPLGEGQQPQEGQIQVEGQIQGEGQVQNMDENLANAFLQPAPVPAPLFQFSSSALLSFNN